MFGYYDHLDGWGWFGMVVGMVAFWGLVLAAGYWLVRSLVGPARTAPTRRPTPDELLAERFARGEIDEAEYLRRLDTLRGHLHA
jgi:putative membrane protein